MPVEVFINFSGNCRQAVEFYAKVFDCEAPKLMTYGDMPPNPDFPPFSEEVKNRVMYTSLNIAGNTVMFSDTTPEMPFVGGNNINITVGDKDVDKIKLWFDRLKDGAAIHMELQKTFWSDCYGMLVDKFGIPWQLSHDSGVQF